MIYDPMEPRKKLEKWRAALPWIKPYFAMKTCPSSLMIADYAKLGVGMDCATKI
jgi:diaminopimelate decarboxylase